MSLPRPVLYAALSRTSVIKRLNTNETVGTLSDRKFERILGHRPESANIVITSFSDVKKCFASVLPTDGRGRDLPSTV